MLEITVIIPTYNRKQSLARALNSVLAQENVAFEILVIDDGSTDKTRELVEGKYPSVTYLAQENQGPSAARNLGIKRAKGNWIAFLDSDDEWLPGKLKAQLDFFHSHPHYQIAQTEEIWIRNGVRVNPMKKHQKFGGEIFEKCLPLCIVSPSAVMIRRELFDEVGFFDETLLACEDYDLWLRIAAKYPIGLLAQPYLIKYGGHSDQQSHKFEAMDSLRIQSLVKNIKAGIFNERQKSQAETILEEKSKIYIQGALKRGKEKEAAEIKTLLTTIVRERNDRNNLNPAIGASASKSPHNDYKIR